MIKNSIAFLLLISLTHHFTATLTMFENKGSVIAQKTKNQHLITVIGYNGTKITVDSIRSWYYKKSSTSYITKDHPFAEIAKNMRMLLNVHNHLEDYLQIYISSIMHEEQIGITHEPSSILSKIFPALRTPPSLSTTEEFNLHARLLLEQFNTKLKQKVKIE